MLNAFDVGMTVHLVDRVSGAMGAVTRSLMSGQMAATALQNKLHSIHNSFNTGTMLIGGGLALAAPLMVAAKRAEDLQEAMTRLQVATKASNGEMAAFDKRLSIVSDKTGVFSKPMLATFATSMRAGGLMDMKSINALLEPFALGADAMKIMSKGKIGPDASVHAFTATAHQRGIYDPNKMMPIIDTAVALAPTMPGGIETLKKWGGVLVGVRNMNLEYAKQSALIAAITQTSGSGGSGKGGLSATNLGNFFSRILPGNFGSGLLKGKSAFALHAMGLSDGSGASTVMKGNKLDLDLLMKKMGQFTDLSTTAMGRMQLARTIQEQEKFLGKKVGGDLDPLLEKAIRTNGMGVSGGQLTAMLNQYAFGSAKGIANLMGDKAFQGQWHRLDTVAKNSKGETLRQQKGLSQTTAFQQMRAATNIDTLMTSFGKSMLGPLKNLFTLIADIANKLNTFVELHPRVTKAIVGLTAAASGMLILGGAANILRAGFMGLSFLGGGLFQAFLRLPGPISAVARGIMMLAPLGLRLAPLLLVSVPLLAGIAVGIGALILVVRNWGNIVEFAKSKVDWLKIGLAALIEAGDAGIKMFKDLSGAIGNMLNSVGAKINGVLKGLNLPQLPDFGKMVSNLKPDQSVVDAANQTLEKKGLLKGIDDWARVSPPLEDPRLSLLKPKDNVVPISSAKSASVNAAPVTINQTNHFHVHAGPHHDARHLTNEIQKQMDHHNQHLSKTITSGQGGLQQFV